MMTQPLLRLLLSQLMLEAKCVQALSICQGSSLSINRALTEHLFPPVACIYLQFKPLVTCNEIREQYQSSSRRDCWVNTGDPGLELVGELVTGYAQL